MKVVRHHVSQVKKYNNLAKGFLCTTLLAGGLMINTAINKNKEIENPKQINTEQTTSNKNKDILEATLLGLSTFGLATTTYKKRKAINDATKALEEVKIAREKNMPVEDYRRLTNEPKPIPGGAGDAYYNNYATEGARTDVPKIKATLEKYEDKTYKIFSDADLARLKELINQYETMKANGTEKDFPEELEYEMMKIYDHKRLFPYI